MMRLFNSLSRQKEEFVPLKEGEVRMYSCGPTVYNYFHIGNARPFIVFDTLRNYFEYRGYQVTFVQNFTDIDDKVINKANEEGVGFEEIAERYIKEYFVDAKGLGIRPATVHPRATETMDDIIAMVQTLVDKGYAYEAGGDVYYRTRKFQDYGKLSHQPLEDLQAGARISVGEQKEDPMDFAVWKAAKPGEPSWPSPWGPGRPGWHIECSVMANKYLGPTIDIHSGGQDLIFPHHENEIAQSEAANGVEFAHYWLHNGFLNVDNQKMSKSLGNFFMVREAAEAYGYDTIRMFMLSAHYRSPINYSEESLKQSRAALDRLYEAVDSLAFLVDSQQGEEMTAEEQEKFAAYGQYRDKFIAAMDDDLNTADAIGAIFELVRQANTDTKGGNPTRAFCQAVYGELMELCGVLNLAQNRQKQTLDSEIEALIEQRQQAKKAKNFAEADRIRDQLRERGIELKDTRQGVQWSYIQ